MSNFLFTNSEKFFHVKLEKIKDIAFTNMAEVVNSINLTEIEQKTYNSFAEFRRDIGWFAHNLRTKQSNSKMARNIVVDAAKKIVETVDEEIKSVKLCSDCYENAYNNKSNFFATPCNPPHILLWANCDEFGYWPAKLMKYNDEDMVNVRFFGDHTNACLPSSNCYIYSEVIPKDSHVQTCGDVFLLAIKVSLLGLFTTKKFLLFTDLFKSIQGSEGVHKKSQGRVW